MHSIPCMTYDTPHIFEISVTMTTILRNMIGFRISVFSDESCNARGHVVLPLCSCKYKLSASSLDWTCFISLTNCNSVFVSLWQTALLVAQSIRSSQALKSSQIHFSLRLLRRIFVQYTYELFVVWYSDKAQRTWRKFIGFILLQQFFLNKTSTLLHLPSSTIGQWLRKPSILPLCIVWSDTLP